MTYRATGPVLPNLETTYTRLARAFGRLGWTMTTPSGDGYVRRVVRDECSIVFTGDCLPLNHAAAHFIAQDKLASYQILSECGVAVPRGLAFFAETHHGKRIGVPLGALLDALPAALSRVFPAPISAESPLVVKPGRESRGAGVRVCRTLAGVLEAARAALGYGHYGLVQEFVPGPEYRVALLDDELLVAYRKEPPASDSDILNLSHGARPELVPNLPNAIVELARRASRVLGLRYSGVDVRHPGGSAEPVIIEVNGNPAFDLLSAFHPELGEEITLRIASAVVEAPLAGARRQT
jgi:glutathione synthase/RimK-type ligase-like ATP-grasp enzyme